MKISPYNPRNEYRLFRVCVTGRTLRCGVIYPCQQENPVSRHDIMLPMREAELIKLTSPNFKKRLSSAFVSHPAANIA